MESSAKQEELLSVNSLESTKIASLGLDFWREKKERKQSRRCMAHSALESGRRLACSSELKLEAVEVYYNHERNK